MSKKLPTLKKNKQRKKAKEKDDKIKRNIQTVNLNWIKIHFKFL